jgi:hypothetical protein
LNGKFNFNLDLDSKKIFGLYYIVVLYRIQIRIRNTFGSCYSVGALYTFGGAGAVTQCNPAPALEVSASVQKSF